MNLLDALCHIGRGMLIGAADVIPGVSGGTMALVVGIYARLIHAIRRFDGTLLRLLWRRRLRQALSHVDAALLIPLGIGMISALFVLTRVVSLPLLLHTHPELVYALFFGLILGSIKLLLSSKPSRNRNCWWWFAGGTVAGLLLATRIPVATPDAAWFIFASGMAATAALMLPGISGSFVLLLLRKYEVILTAVAYLQLHIVIPFALGAVTALLLFSRVLAWLLAHFYSTILHFMGGLLLGSLWLVWPFQLRQYELIGGKQRQIAASPMLPEHFDSTFWSATALMALGFLLVIALAHFGGHTRPRDA